MKRPGPKENNDDTELAALRELPTAAVALAVEAALATIVSVTAISPLLHSLALVYSFLEQIHPSVTFLHSSQPSLSPESHASPST